VPTTRPQLHDAPPPREPSETLDQVVESVRLLQRAVAAPARGEIPVVPDLVVPGRDGTPVIGYRAPTGHNDGYRGFEDVFRGSEAEIRRRMQIYLPLLCAHSPVLELGCGRGELLELLREAGAPARGVDIDPSMVRRSREKVLDVTEGDALGYLAKEPDASAGAVFSAQLVEHLRTEDLVAVFATARRVLRPGGVFVAETVNPHCPAARKNFWLDPTHQRPLFPETLVVLCRQAGYAKAEVSFPGGTGALEDDLLAVPDYALVAVR
jgi:SAM-dependent methyltransferase